MRDLSARLRDIGVMVPLRRRVAARSQAFALGQIRPEAKEVVPALRAALNDLIAQVRSAAALALGEIGPEAKDAVPDLRAALKDQDGDVRRAAAEALRKIGR